MTYQPQPHHDAAKTETPGNPPKTIWLQWNGDQESDSAVEPHGVTWADIKIFPYDVQYVLASENAALLARAERAEREKMDALRQCYAQQERAQEEAINMSRRLQQTEHDFAALRSHADKLADQSRTLLQGLNEARNIIEADCWEERYSLKSALAAYDAFTKENK